MMSKREIIAGILVVLLATAFGTIIKWIN